VRCRVTPRALTPALVHSDASYTGPAGTLHLSLEPGVYVLTALGSNADGDEISGHSDRVTIEAGQTVAVAILVS